MTSKRLALSALVAGLVSLAATTADAGHLLSGSSAQGKPPKEPTATPAASDGGTIYYKVASGGDGLRAISPDGSGDHPIAGVTGMGYTRPSRVGHANERWYLTLRPSSPGFFPGGADNGRLHDLDLVRESDPGNPIPLTSNGGTCIQMFADSKMYDWASSAAGVVDGAVSWLGTRWADDDNDGSCDRVIDSGVFRAELTIGTDGSVTFTQPTAPEVSIALSGSQTEAEAFDWSPAGDQVSYVVHTGTNIGLWVATTTGASRIYGGWATEPAWSPDQDPGTTGLQSQIAFHRPISGSGGGNYATYVVNPDGSGLSEVARGALAKGTKPAVYNAQVQWSPAGSHLAYLAGSMSAGWTLRTVQKSGGSNTALVSAAGWLNGWATND